VSSLELNIELWRVSSELTGHDSVICSRSERPANSVHWHAQSVPANLGRHYTQSVWANLTYEVCGPRVTFQVHWPMGFDIIAWTSTSASSGLSDAYLYLEGCIMVARSEHVG
jgi:hypothetical protein